MFASKILISTIILAFSFGCQSADNLTLVNNKFDNLRVEETKNQENIEKIIDEIPSNFLVTLDKPQCQGFEVCQIYKIFINSPYAKFFENLFWDFKDHKILWFYKQITFHKCLILKELKNRLFQKAI